MYNEFKLSPMEKKQLIQDNINLTSQYEIEISYYEEGSGTSGPGYDDPVDEGGWTPFDTYEGIFVEVDEWTKRRYDYGDVKEGDVIVLLPPNTNLPESDSYRFKHDDDIYTSDSKYRPVKYLDGTVVHYYLVGGR